MPPKKTGASTEILMKSLQSIQIIKNQQMIIKKIWSNDNENITWLSQIRPASEQLGIPTFEVSTIANTIASIQIKIIGNHSKKGKAIIKIYFKF